MSTVGSSNAYSNGAMPHTMLRHISRRFQIPEPESTFVEHLFVSIRYAKRKEVLWPGFSMRLPWNATRAMTSLSRQVLFNRSC